MAKDEEREPTVRSVQDAWTRAIEDFNKVANMDGFVGWMVKYVPDAGLRRRVVRYARHGIRNQILLDRLVEQAFEAFRAPYDEHFGGNMGIAMAPDSQAFSFRTIVDRLVNGEGKG